MKVNELEGRIKNGECSMEIYEDINKYSIISNTPILNVYKKVDIAEFMASNNLSYHDFEYNHGTYFNGKYCIIRFHDRICIYQNGFKKLEIEGDV